MNIRAPRKDSAAPRSSTECALATTPPEWSLASLSRSFKLPAKFTAPLSAGSRNHCLEENSASGLAL